MEITGKVHCFFEQSGTFKNEFKKLGYEAYDYDIQNNFGETDYVVDLFGEIDRAYDNLTRQDKTRQDKTRQDIIRFNRTLSRPCGCFLSLYLLLCYVTDGFLFRIYKLQKTKQQTKDRADFTTFCKKNRVLRQAYKVCCCLFGNEYKNGFGKSVQRADILKSKLS